VAFQSEYKTYDELLIGPGIAGSSHGELSNKSRVDDWAWKRFDGLDMVIHLAARVC